MKILLTQRQNFAKIHIYENYCDINRKMSHILSSHDITGLRHVETFPIVTRIKNYLYFDKFYELNRKEEFITTDDLVIKNHYGNPFATVIAETLERQIKIIDDKIIIKTYHVTKTRYAQTKFFKKKTGQIIITIDLKTGNFKIINVNTKTKTFRTNNFMSLENHLFQIITINNLLKDIVAFDDYEFLKTISTALGSNTYLSNQHQISDYIVKMFVDKKKIKVPNDYDFFLYNWYPTEKFLKKNDRKLIQSILDAFNIKSKITNKILHQNPGINVFEFAQYCHLFGKDYNKYVAMVNWEFLCVEKNRARPKLIESGLSFSFFRHQMETNNIDLKLKTEDKQKIIKLINISKNERHLFTVVYDHLRMLKTIREYDEMKSMNFNTYDEFMQEHNDFSDICSKIKKGWTVEYQFNNDMVTDVEKPIEIKINIGDEKNPQHEKMIFYPKILKREEEYIEEGRFMHHCVAGYADKETSIIISLRTLDEKDRITCEFDSQRGNCLQARHFCNRPIPGDFDLALDDLKEKTTYYGRRGMLHYTHKKRVPVKINNKEVEPPKITAQLNDFLFPDNI